MESREQGLDAGAEVLCSVFRGKNIAVTGGTGSFGHQIVRELFQYEPASIRIYSRDEKKQYDMRTAYAGRSDLVFLLGDVRDFDRTREVMQGVHIVFHAAALKQVPNCEFAPFEAVQTNICGANNVRRAAIEAGVETVVAVSTDKAVKPVNVMGMSKAIQERIMLDPAHSNGTTKFVCVRYGNVLGSRGSVVPLFYNCIQQGLPLPITHPAMTRFQLTLKKAVGLVLLATVRGKTGELWVRKMPAARLADLASALSYGVTGRHDYPQRIVGVRPGEKMHEVLVSEEEMWRATEYAEYYLIPSWAAPQGRSAGPGSGSLSEYSSDLTHQMTRAEILGMLDADGWFGEKAPAGPACRAEVAVVERP